MNEKDDGILEYLRSIHPSAEPLTVIHWNLEQSGASWSRNTTRRRLEMLTEAGLLEVAREKNSYRRITDDGIAYLDGEFDAGDIPRSSV